MMTAEIWAAPVLFLLFDACDEVPTCPSTVASASERISSTDASLLCFFEESFLRAIAFDKTEQNLMTRTRRNEYCEWRWWWRNASRIYPELIIAANSHHKATSGNLWSTSGHAPNIHGLQPPLSSARSQMFRSSLHTMTMSIKPFKSRENSKNSHEKTWICKNSHDPVLNFKTSHLHIKFRCSPDSVRTAISHWIQREKYPLVKWLGGWC